MPGENLKSEGTPCLSFAGSLETLKAGRVSGLGDHLRWIQPRIRACSISLPDRPHKCPTLLSKSPGIWHPCTTRMVGNRLNAAICKSSTCCVPQSIIAQTQSVHHCIERRLPPLRLPLCFLCRRSVQIISSSDIEHPPITRTASYLDLLVISMR